MHLSQDERYQIQWLDRGGFSTREIGAQIGRHASTVSRELRRNGTDRYEARPAHRQSTRRRHSASARPRIDPVQWVDVRTHLDEGWSPQQIAGRGDVAISHERIYQYIAADRQLGGVLWRSLRCRKHRRRHRCGTPRQRQRFGGRRISTRPVVVARRTRIGDWEGDTIVGKGLTRVLTLVDRKSGLLRLRRVASGGADATMRAVVHTLYPLSDHVKTLTWDNGSEFAMHALIDEVLGARSYFADPYASWQRGSNENTNGLLRQYLPKGCDLAHFSDDQLQHIEDKLNNRPRKRLGYQTPNEVFDLALKRVALRN